MVNHTKFILRFDIRFWNRPVQKKEGPATGRYSAAGQTGSPFRTIQPERVEIVRKGLQGAGALLSWPEAGTCGIPLYPTVKLFAHPVRPQSGEHAAVHFVNYAG